jgi:enoyl-CoA hydratase/carnithine racemase
LIVAGAGTAFSSGFDLKEQMERRPVGVEAWRPILRKDFDTIMRFWHFPRPTIATVRGPCLAGACELALTCDITIASEDAFFGEPELKFGAGIVAMILPWVVGPKIAKEIILLGQDRIPAARAREIGMVNRVVASDELEGSRACNCKSYCSGRPQPGQGNQAGNQSGIRSTEYAGSSRRGTRH